MLVGFLLCISHFHWRRRSSRSQPSISLCSFSLSMCVLARRSLSFSPLSFQILLMQWEWSVDTCQILARNIGRQWKGSWDIWMVQRSCAFSLERKKHVYLGTWMRIMLVRISRGLSSMCTFTSSISLSSSTSQMKWYFTTVCFVFAWNTGFFANMIALWLSQCNVGTSTEIPKSPTSRASHIASLHASHAAIYSASVVDMDVQFCKRDRQETAPPVKLKT